MTTKRKDGDVLEIVWYGDAKPPVHVVHGHVAYDAAIESLTAKHGKDAAALDVSAERARHRWARWVQAERILKDQGVPRQLHLQDARGRGLFPVTVLATTAATDRWR